MAEGPPVLTETVHRLEPGVRAAWAEIVTVSQRNEKNQVKVVCQYKAANHSFRKGLSFTMKLCHSYFFERGSKLLLRKDWEYILVASF